MLALAAWFAIGRALRPVERLRRQAEAISETALDRRLAAPSTTELRILADTLNDLLDRVDHAVTRQREFVADAAHELRSPLASLRTQIEVGDRDAPPDSRELIRQVDRLSRLVDDLLALAKVDEADPSQGVAVDLDDVVLECVADIRTRSAVQIDVSAVSAAQTTGHRSALERLVRNLIQNAVQHATTRVAVTLATRGHEVELVVADDGPGIPPADRQRVFERFTRLDSSRDRASGGVGLGLAIAAEVVAAHDGEIDIHDNAPGAAFVVRLPAAVPTPLRSAQQVDGVPV